MDEVFKYTNTEITKINDLILQTLSGRDKYIKDIGTYLISAGGKRLRPILTILSAKLFNYKGTKHIYAAASIELIHTATLLHDDVVDHSKLRRGKTTVNQLWNNKYAVLVGDFLLSQAFKMMVSVNSIEILNIMSTSSSIISEGEVKQVSNIGNLNINKEDYYNITKSKTAELFAAACQSGAVISNQPNYISSKLYKVGFNAGISFQIIDDLLDYIATEKTLGKRVGDDFYEKKITLPIIILYENASTHDKKQIESIFQNLTQQDFCLLLNLVKKYNIINLVKEEALHYINISINTLETIDTSSKAKNIFINLLKSQIQRLY